LNRATLLANKRYPGTVYGTKSENVLFWPLFIILLVGLPIALLSLGGTLFYTLILTCFMVVATTRKLLRFSRWASRLLKPVHSDKVWSDGFYALEFHGDWPALELTGQVVHRLKAAGMSVFRPIDPGQLSSPGLTNDGMPFAAQIEPLSRQLYLLETRRSLARSLGQWNFRIAGSRGRTFTYVIRPIRTYFDEDQDELIKTVAGVLWDHEIDQIRAGMRPTVPGLRWD
jgi:hypothetical protein